MGRRHDKEWIDRLNFLGGLGGGLEGGEVRSFRVAVKTPDDVEILRWKTQASTSQNALWNFLRMLEDTLGSEYQLKGDFQIEVREIEEVEEMIATRGRWPRPA